MKSFIVLSLFLFAHAASALTIETEKSNKTTAYVNSSKIKVRVSYKRVISACDSENVSIAINAVDYADQSNSSTALEKRIYVIEARSQMIGDMGCEGNRPRKTITVRSEWKEIDLSQGRLVNMVEIHNDAKHKLEIKEI